ncbi:MAG: MBOAT family protein [Candidatus Methanofastidiosa archaeon]|nr:MBOAT family protein [Candidatus Methanofastidiosa archaeon]
MIYNDEIKPEKNLGKLALFISFFPLILSGPIERAKNMLPQFNAPRKINYDLVEAGLKMMLWGYFMKLVVADRIGFYVDAVFNNLSQHNGTSILFASVLYPFQIYADLGGYSLLAIGTAKVLGFEVMQNFRRPFFATTMSEFWRRWHISLISWLTDYIFTPLSFSFRKYKIWGIVIALMITFLISGIWHGAALTFVMWGLVQGIFLSIEALTNKRRVRFEESLTQSKKSWYLTMGCVIVFILFSTSQIFSRSSNIHDALTVYQKIFTQPGPLFLDKTTLAYALIGLTLLLIKDFLEEFYPQKIYLFENKCIVVRYISYLTIIFMILLFGILNSSQFIYFQF